MANRHVIKVRLAETMHYYMHGSKFESEHPTYLPLKSKFQLHD